MKKVGRISELWRYPISSLSGEKCDTVNVDMRGIVGDRAFGIYDVTTGNVAAPEKDIRWRPALFLQSKLGENGLPRIHFPDGTVLSIIDETTRSRLADHFGFNVAVGRYAHTNLPAASSLPIISNRYDPNPLHIITTHSLTTLAGLASLNEMDHRRFRPSILVETDVTALDRAEPDVFLEESWLGGMLHIGALKAEVTEKAKRCGMIFISQPNLSEQPDILRTLVRRNARNFGIYCTIRQSSTLAVEANVNLDI